MARIALLLAALFALSAAPATTADARAHAVERSAARPVLLGLLGARDRFERLTGQRTRAGHVIAAWGQGPVNRILDALGETPMLGINTGGRLTPRDIAYGQGDAWLAELNAAVAARPGLVYVRALAEMNGHWNDYSAFNRNGSARGTTHTTAMFRKAFARIYLLVHGAGRLRL